MWSLPWALKNSFFGRKNLCMSNLILIATLSFLSQLFISHFLRLRSLRSSSVSDTFEKSQKGLPCFWVKDSWTAHLCFSPARRKREKYPFFSQEKRKNWKKELGEGKRTEDKINFLKATRYLDVKTQAMSGKPLTLKNKAQQ